MPDTFTFEEAAPPKSFSFEDANSFTFEEAAPRDTSRDSYEAQLADAGLTPQQAEDATRRSDKQAELFAAQQEARRTGEYWQGVADRIDALTGNVVEPLTRPLSGALGRAADVVVPGPPVVEPTLQQSGLHLPRAGAAETPGGKVVAGTYNAAADLLSALTSADAVALLPAAANKTVLTAWISQMAGHAPERVVKATELFKAGKTQEAVQEVASAVGELGLAELGRRHVMRDPAAPTAADVEGAPRLNINQRGEVVDLPQPDTVARNVAAPGTLRPQEVQAFGPPEAARPPDLVQFERVPIFNRAGEVVEVQEQPVIVGRRLILPVRNAAGEIVGVREQVALAEGAARPAEPPGVIEPVTRGTVRENPAGGKVSFAAEAPVLNREALGPRGLKSEAENLIPAEPVKENLVAPPPEKPGLVSGTAAEAWADRTIAEGRTRMNVGVDPELMAAYLTKGVAHLERGTRQFAAWSRKMIAEHGDAIRPHLRTLFEQSTRALEQLTADGRNMRGLSKRGAASEQLPEAARDRLGVDPASFYQRQQPRTIEDAAARMTNTELRQPLDLTKEGNAQNWVARQLELSRRLMADAATREEGYALFQQLSQTGTSFGQLVNQFTLLRNATPDGLLEIVNRRLAEQGAPALTPAQRLQLRVLAGQNLKEVSAWRRAEEAWSADPSAANFKAVVEAQRAAEAGGRFFNERVQRLVPRGFWDTLTAMSMGGKLSMLSQERNVVANLALMPWRAAARVPAAALDMLDSMVRNKPREIALVPQHSLAGAGRSALAALPESARVLWRGDTSSGLGKSETHVNLRPLVALREIIAGELLKPDKSMAHRLTLLAEASPPAYFAAGMLRGLNALDLPSRAAARGRLIAEELKLAEKRSGGAFKATAERVRQATQAPELFLSPDALARINREALGSVFQDPNVLTRWVLGLEQVAPGPARFLLRNVVPFISLPVNWAGKLLGWSPAGFATHAARHALQGNSRAAKLAAGEAIVGSMAWLAASYLFNKGVVSPPLDMEDEQQKMRLLSGDIMPPNHLNLSGLNRLLSGRDPRWQPGDKTKDFTYYGSVVGAQMQMVAAARRMAEKQPAPSGLLDEWSSFLWNATAGAGGYLVNQTFMQGVRDLLDAFRSEGKMETWLASYAGALTDTAVPRQMESVNKAVREYQRELKDDALDKRLHNVLVNRLGLFTRADDELPFKRDIWGRPLRETPEGANPWLYQLFDVGKSRQITADPIKVEIYNLARRTADPRAIPTPPDKSLTIQGTTYQLTAAQHSRLQELVGEQRADLAERVFTARFLTRTDEQKLAILNNAWSLGALAGQARFYREAKDDLQRKAKPVGFQPR